MDKVESIEGMKTDYSNIQYINSRYKNNDKDDDLDVEEVNSWYQDSIGNDEVTMDSWYQDYDSCDDSRIEDDDSWYNNDIENENKLPLEI